MLVRARMRPLALLALGLWCAGAGACAPRPRYLVERSAADFQIAPDYRDLRPRLLELLLEQTRALLAGNEGDASVWLSIGALHLALGRRDSAEACYARAVHGFESNARALPPRTVPAYGEIRARSDALVALGVTRAAAGDPVGARRCFEGAAGPWLAPYPEAQREKARIAEYSTGLSWELEGRPERARRVYDTVLRRGEWTRARYARACAWGAAGRLDSALADFERVSRSRVPERRIAPYHMGRILELQADTLAAIDAYRAFLGAQTVQTMFRASDSLETAVRDTMIAEMERAADERTRGLYSDARQRLERLKAAVGR